ncbi:uncharacterized protein K02A2.6-like [Mercenaria mercenaria]|uniref:uncharacterized protein K02A2.6-like n=1 Tax=Mercenaria mercenaria TaxID=6596 RepID=UPI00234EBB98|nr:uncharacterized protein K02A2.6-like [Mercenaria mercenaria]
MKDFQLQIPIDEKIEPVVQSVRRIPFSLREKLEKKLLELENNDIIERVNSPSRWVSPVVVVPKGDDDIRLVIDIRRSNTAAKRVRHPIPTVDEVLYDLNGSTVYSKLDISNAYHQLELHPDSREVTTFITHVGMFRYKRLLQGVSCASEMFQKVLEQVLQNCPGTRNIMDDIIVHAPTKDEHQKCLENVLRVLHEKGFTLNSSKCQFEMSKVTFMGNVLSEHGVGPTESKVRDVLNARAPRNAAEVRSFLGLVNFNARYIQNLASISEPMRRLTRKNVRFKWGREEQNSFDTLKQKLASAEILGYFDINAKTQVVTDASPYGLSAVLTQRQGNDYRVICYASRSLTDVERRYSVTEKECAGVIFGVERFHTYLHGIDFELVTDCKAVQYIFAPKSKPSARIERWVLRLQGYRYTMRHVPSRENISDCLSRLLADDKEKRMSYFIDDDNYILNIARAATPEAVTTREIEKASRYDPEMSSIRDCLMYGLWYKIPFKEYLIVKNELSAIGFLVLRGTRIVVPKELRSKILEAAHSGHPGIVSMKQSLRTRVWWPQIDQDIEKYCKSCHGCQLEGPPAPPEPLKPTELPSGPWEYLACDLLGPLPTGEHLVVVIDFYSRFMEIEIVKSTTSENIATVLMKMFARHGTCFLLRTDNASYFTSDYFKSFLKEHGIKLTHSTPLAPNQNGQVERQMSSIMKRIRIAIAEKRNWKHELQTYLLMYRSSPHATTGVSPAELLYGRKIRTKVPCLQEYGKFDLSDQSVRDRDCEKKEKSKQYTDQKRNAVENSISVGDLVLLRNKKKDKTDTRFSSKPYTVTQKHGNSVTIERDGVQYNRDVTHLKKYETPFSENTSHEKKKCMSKKPEKYKDYVCENEYS